MDQPATGQDYHGRDFLEIMAAKVFEDLMKVTDELAKLLIVIPTAWAPMGLVPNGG